MRLLDFQESLKLKALSVENEDVCFDGVYAGDLLSRCMSHVKSGGLWLTIMNNLNVIAVASLTEPAAVILAEGVLPPEEVITTARSKNVAIFSSELSVYEICAILSRAAQ